MPAKRSYAPCLGTEEKVKSENSPGAKHTVIEEFCQKTQCGKMDHLLKEEAIPKKENKVSTRLGP